jgi:hypothetical protein
MAKISAKPEKNSIFHRQNLRFTDECQNCKKMAKVMTFSRRLSHKITPEGWDLSEYVFSGTWVCSFDCFKQTPEYASELQKAAQANQ